MLSIDPTPIVVGVFSGGMVNAWVGGGLCLIAQKEGDEGGCTWGKGVGVRGGWNVCGRMVRRGCVHGGRGEVIRGLGYGGIGGGRGRWERDWKFRQKKTG